MVGDGEAVVVAAGLKGLYQDEVAVDVVGKYDEVVPAAGADGEAAHVVGVEFAGGFDAHDELFCFDRGGRGGRVGVGHLVVGAGRSGRGFGFGRGRGLCGAHALARLLDVSLEGRKPGFGYAFRRSKDR